MPVWAFDILKAGKQAPMDGWSCPTCGTRGYAINKQECLRCSAPRPQFRLLIPDSEQRAVDHAEVWQEAAAPRTCGTGAVIVRIEQAGSVRVEGIGWLMGDQSNQTWPAAPHY